MLVRSFVQLLRAMLQRPFGQKVDHLAPTFMNPVDRLMAVDEPEHFHPFENATRCGVSANHLHRVLLTGGHPCGSHFHSVYVHVGQEFAGDHQLLMRQEGHSARLFSVAEGAVHDLYYDLLFSHATTFSLFSTKKSTSSRPFIRQCFL